MRLRVEEDDQRTISALGKLGRPMADLPRSAPLGPFVFFFLSFYSNLLILQSSGLE
jgi:hypothetical protein